MTYYSFAGMPEEIQLLASDKQMILSKEICDFDIDKMIRAACKITNADYSQTMLGKRKRECIEAKRLVCYFLRRYTKMTLSNIGKHLLIDHATVMHHTKQFNNLIEVNDAIIFEYLTKFKSANMELVTKYKRM
jgi:chromosomal replication initiation ATPase DnaA